VLVNNAGITKDGLFMMMPREDWHQVLDTTLTGFYNVTKPVLKKMVRRLGVEGYLTIQLAFPAFNPLPAGLDDDLKSLGFFFSGILARTPENWLLLYTCLNNQEFDFSEIKLCEDIALTLRDYVRDCCESLE